MIKPNEFSAPYRFEIQWNFELATGRQRIKKKKEIRLIMVNDVWLFQRWLYAPQTKLLSYFNKNRLSVLIIMNG